MTEPISVLVVDDHPLFRKGVVDSLRTASDIKVVGEVSSGEEALASACELLPNIVLLDLSMPGWNGIVTTKKLTSTCPCTSTVILTASEDQDMLLDVFKAGARAYVLKGISAQELVSVIRNVAKGESYVSPSLASEILVSLTENQASDPLQALTAREREILNFIASGLTNREIGQNLDISEKTVKHYVTNILQKLQVRSRVEAALIAVKAK